MTSIAPLVLAAGLAQAAAAAPAPDAAAVPPDPAAVAQDPTAVPPGTPEDQRLWRQLREASNTTTIGMGRISQCSYRIRYGRYYENLDAALENGTDAERAEARPLREKLAAEALAADRALPDKPGLRECQYALRDLGLYMQSVSDPAAKKAISQARKKARGCVTRLKPLAERLLARADALEGALAAIDAFQVNRAASALAAPAADPKDAAAAPAAPARAPAAAPAGAPPAAGPAPETKP